MTCLSSDSDEEDRNYAQDSRVVTDMSATHLEETDRGADVVEEDLVRTTVKPVEANIDFDDMFR